MADFVKDIGEFHKKFEIEYKGPPRLLPLDIQEFRNKFMEEELDEYEIAVNEVDATRSTDRITDSLEEQLDALVDLVYVAIGTAHLHGFDFNEAWRRVHEANMKKVLAKSAAESTRGYAKDVVKPPGWQAPSHRDLVENHAHQVRTCPGCNRHIHSDYKNCFNCMETSTGDD